MRRHIGTGPPPYRHGSRRCVRRPRWGTTRGSAPDLSRVNRCEDRVDRDAGTSENGLTGKDLRITHNQVLILALSPNRVAPAQIRGESARHLSGSSSRWPVKSTRISPIGYKNIATWLYLSYGGSSPKPLRLRPPEGEKFFISPALARNAIIEWAGCGADLTEFG